MINYDWRHVLIGLDEVDPWGEVNQLCHEGWEVFKIEEHTGRLCTCKVVYLRCAKGFYTQTQTCPHCHRCVTDKPKEKRQ